MDLGEKVNKKKNIRKIYSMRDSVLESNDARLILRAKLTGQRHDRVQTESQELQP